MRLSSALPHGVLFSFVILIIVATTTPAHAQVGINIFGLSKHFANDYSSKPQGINPGVGLHWTFDRGRSTALECNAGFYRDSFREINSHASLGARTRVCGALEVGFQAILAKSNSMNGGKAIFYPIPFISLRYSEFVLHSMYIPEIGSFNGIPTLAFTATIFPFGDGFQWDDPSQQHSQRRSFLEFNFFDFLEMRGYRDFGIAWRRMFDQRHGMRFGFDLVGSIDLREDRDYGEFNSRVLVQYLRRLSSVRRSGCFIAGGLRVGFVEEGVGSRMNYELVLNLGWEYSLSSDFSVFVESGMALNYGYQISHVDSRRGPQNTYHQTFFKSDGITIGITAGL